VLSAHSMSQKQLEPEQYSPGMLHDRPHAPQL
jgi:hypothetical protein